MTQFTVVNHDSEQTFIEESSASAQERKQSGVEDFGFAEEDLDVVQGAWEDYTEIGDAKTDGGDPGTPAAKATTPEPLADKMDAEPTEPTVVDDTEQLPDDPSVADDPVDWLPSHFIDSIQGVPTVNRKGYAVIASKYDVSVEAEPVTLPSATEFEYAEFRATATTADGETYSGFGSAHVDRMDGDDKHLLAELAETRAMKRATAWATGVGMTAVSELQGTLNEP